MAWMTASCASMQAVVACASPEFITKNLPRFRRILKRELSSENLQKFMDKPEEHESLKTMMAIIKAIAEMKKGNGHKLSLGTRIRSRAEGLMRWHLSCGSIPPGIFSKDDYDIFFNACTLAICRGKKSGEYSYKAKIDDYRIIYKFGQHKTKFRYSGGKSKEIAGVAPYKTAQIYRGKKLIFHVRYLYSDNRVYRDTRWFTPYNDVELFNVDMEEKDRIFFRKL